MRHIPILMYHNIDTPPVGAKLRKLYVRKHSFALQMGLLKLLGYRGVSLRDAEPYFSGEKTGKVVVITFDDGYLDTLKNALPVLQKNGFTATCYCVSQRLDSYNQWDAEKLSVRKSLMNVEQLRQWNAAGMEVGGHSRTHPHLHKCSEEELHEEIIGGKADLEALLQQEISHFCYPYGSYNSRVIEVVQAAGYKSATTTQRGRAHSNSHPFELPRIFVGGHHWLPMLLMQIMTGYEDKRGK